MLEKDKEEKEDSIKKNQEKNKKVMSHLLGYVPIENVGNKLEAFHTAKKKEVQQLQEQLQASKMEHCREDTNRKHILKQLKKKKTELRSIKETLMSECGNQDVDILFQNLQQSISELQSEEGAVMGNTSLYEECIHSLESTYAHCSLCHSGFYADEVLELIEELQDKMCRTQEKEKSITQQREKLSKLQQLQSLKEKMAKLSNPEIPNLKTQLASVTNNLEKLANKIKEEERKLSMTQEDETTAVNLIPDITILDAHRIDLKKLKQKINTHQQGIRGQRRIRTIGEVWNELETLLGEDDLEKSKAYRELRVKNLRGNIQLRKNVAKIEDIEERMKGLQKCRDGIPVSSDHTKRKKLTSEYLDLKERKNVELGKMSALEKEVKKMEGVSEEYRTAGDDYNEAVIDFHTTKIARADLHKYSEALDTAIIKYHKMKMQEINQFVKQYWRMTYKGNDIDYIEIRSEPVASTMTRKSYNYRVVMVKGDTEMDMRGRCSAGQKVLASLIIRLALSEIFCLTCGVLTLDEPTTNLDCENVEGLAHALVEIIKGREDQRNFQLIVITHNKEFIELLGRSDYADYFYMVTKNNEAKSIITKTNIAELT